PRRYRPRTAPGSCTSQRPSAHCSCMPGRSAGKGESESTGSTPWNTESVSRMMPVLARAAIVAAGPPPTLRVEGEFAAVAVVEPADGGRDRHAILVEQPRVVHDDPEPLRVELPVRATELRHVGVHGELLPRDEEVRVHDRRLDHRPAVDRA